MKYIITESQQQRLKNRMTELLNFEFMNSNVVCEIRIRDVSEDEDDYENGLKYDIDIFINSEFVRIGGFYGFVIATKKKIKSLLEKWFSLIEDVDYSISVLAKDCNSKSLNESVNLFLRRRLNEIKEIVKLAMERTDPEEYNFKDYLDEICWQVVDEYNYESYDWTSEDLNKIMEYVKNNFHDEIEEYYISKIIS